ncbi:MAG: 1-acyl-sn-glycerol-3-phosphate acyltransferase [Candidatus Aminicenantes bacterium]|nr:1-acyl-sn-glycerol-3-phosphate acyltransferase [Candidatus Aminicenantes bacterium]
MVGMRLLRNILAFLTAFLLILFSFIPVLIVSGLFKHKKFLFSQSRLVIKTTLAILGVQAKVLGLAAVDFSAPQVVICNHLSNLDGPLLVSVLPVNPRVLIKAEARKIPLVGWVMKLADFVFVDRSSPQRRQEALAAAIEKVKKMCYSFLVFPEGTRSKDGRMRDFKKGSFLIALRAGVPILPVKISGTHQLMPAGRKTVGAGTVEIEFFPRQELKNIAESELAEFIKKLQQKFYTDKNHENH